MDSGTAVTRLETAMYEAVMARFRGCEGFVELYILYNIIVYWLSEAGRVALFDTCYDLSGWESVSVLTSDLHFGGGSREEKEESVEGLLLNFTDISYDYTIYDDKKVEKEVEVTFKRSNEPQEESKEVQPLVLVKLPPMPCICIEFYAAVEENEH
ncbi:hypothetical protein Scep_021883 [Stephania cephalantha]|uniref:Uncharacterized protein n=1 Tax=Stephania cephalantha TaxID=152367 RepID=A0AAP0FF53_9MAGN